MIRDTSIEAFNQIKREGLLSKRRLQAYEIVFQNGPLTMNQLIKIAEVKYNITNPGSFNTRLSELRNFGVLKEIDEAPCPVTGRKVIWWDVTSELPKKISQKQKLLEQIDFTSKKLDAMKNKYFRLYREFPF